MKDKTDGVKIKRPPFTMVENQILEDKRLSKHAKLIYVFLCKHADSSGQNCFPSLTTIQRETRSGRKIVVNAIAELEKYHYIEKKNRKLHDKAFTSNLYKIVLRYTYRSKHIGSSNQNHPSSNQNQGSSNEVLGGSSDEILEQNSSSYQNLLNNNKQPVVELFNSDQYGTFKIHSKYIDEYGKTRIEAVILYMDEYTNRENIKNPPGFLISILKTDNEDLKEIIDDYVYQIEHPPYPILPEEYTKKKTEEEIEMEKYREKAVNEYYKRIAEGNPPDPRPSINQSAMAPSLKNDSMNIDQRKELEKKNMRNILNSILN